MAAATSPEEQKLWRAFYAMRRQLELSLERRLQADAGISAADFEVLMVLHTEPTKRLRAGQIGDLTGWEKSRVSHQITRMEQRGLVKRQECGDDARGVWVVLTEDGTRAVSSTLPDREAAIREYFFDLLTDEEKQVLLDVSTRVVDKIDPPICAELNLREPAGAAASA